MPGLHAGRLRRGEPRAEFMSPCLAIDFGLRRTAGCALPLLHAFLRAGGLRRGKPRAEAVPLGGRRRGPPSAPQSSQTNSVYPGVVHVANTRFQTTQK